MKKNFIKKLVAGFSLSALVSAGVIYACGGGDYWGYDYSSSFAPEVYADPSYRPLFFSSEEQFYGIGYLEDGIGRFNTNITQDWNGYLKGVMSVEDINYLLLDKNAGDDISDLYTSVEKKKKNTVRPSVDIKEPKVKNFIKFLADAKRVEAYSTTSYNYWEYEETAIPVASKSIGVDLEKKYQGISRDEFLKNRYWFQTMKAYFYGEDKNDLIRFFDATAEQQPKNLLYYRGLAYVAGAHYRAKEYAKSNYLYSIVFDKSPELRTVTAYSFRPQQQADFDQSLNLAKTADEKVALWAMLGYYTNERKAIEEIYKLNPNSVHLEFLLTRLVNIEESKLNTYYSDLKAPKAYRSELKNKLDSNALSLVKKIAKEEKTTKPYLWHLANGYLSIYNQEYDFAKREFDLVEKTAPKSELASNQLRLLRLINQLSATDKIDSKTDKGLVAELRWLNLTVPSQMVDDGVFRYSYALDWSRKYVASLYEAQKDKVMAELFSPTKEYYYKAADLEAMKTLMRKGSLNEWEKLGMSIYRIKLEDINEFQAIQLTYANRIPEAISFMEQVDSIAVLQGNPFNGKIKDCNDCDHVAVQKVKYSKLDFLKKMQEMQANIAAGRDVYNNALLLGNAFYNLSYFGNARVFYDNPIVDEYGNYISKLNQQRLHSNKNANSYYQMALKAATNDEQRARCTYMMTKCERNAFYTDKYYTDNNYYGYPSVNFIAFNGYKQLEAKYSNTNFYNEVINECGYFRKYLEN
ncbi:hypothetical protein [Flavobacterium sp. HSC-61S13]|uniref:hypothetical protein n=1 Tax=Flavobacterium sp. HSC-61S13 TaxID=2910963 RepID=UPI00209EDB05|nr:hypothetical protein [Flavobacterium sp. HSC-61S13]MCP1994820.1 hypothetical protein [Flavobacterium sp. HSC-61S13]